MAADGIVDPFKPAASPAGNGIVDPFRAPSPAVSAPSAPAATPKLQLPRTWGQAATDLGIGLGEGAVSATMAVPQLLNTATGGAVDRYLWKPVTGAVDRLAGGPGEGRTLAESSQDTRSFLDEHKSPQLRQAEQELANTQGFLPSAKKILTNPMLLGQQVAEQAPQFLVPASAARTVGARVLERAGAEALAKGTAKRVAAGMGAEEAAKLAMPAARRLGERAASKAAGRAVMATGGAIGASQASEQAQQEVMGLDQKVLDANPQYQQLRAQGLSDVDARRELAVTAGMKAAAIALPLDTLASGLTARLEGNIFRGTTGVNGVGQLLSRRGAAGVAKAAGKEGAEETLQEGGEQFAQNVGVQGVDPNKSLMDQVPEQAAIGGTIGAVLGGAGFAGSASLSRPQTHAVPNPGAAPGSLSDAANVLQQPATGPVGRAAQEAVRSGATAAAQAAQAAQAASPTENAAAPAPAPAQAAPAAQAATPGPMPEPGPAPWADPTTGEIRAPSKGQLTLALSDYILDTYLQAGHMRINAQAVADAWGVPKADVNRVRQAATKSATARVAAAEREAMQPAASPAPGFDDIAADIDRTHNAAAERLDQAIAPPENVDATDERIPEPAPAAPAGAGAQAAGATDAQPAAISDGAGSAAAQAPAPGGAADVAGDGAATDTLAPLTTETPNAEAPDQAAATTGPEGQPAGVAGEGGSAAVEPAAEGAAPQAAAESPVARPPAAAQPNQVAEPEPKTPRAPKAPRGGSGKAAGGSSPAQAVARIETVGSKGIRLHGDAEAIRAQLAAGGFKKRGTPQKGALRFDAADRQRIEAALAAATGKDSLKVAAPEANEDRQQQIQQGFADNKAAIATHKYKAGDTVTFVANGKTVTGTIAKGDKAGMVKDMGIFEVEYPGRNGMARATVGARFLSPAEPAVPTGSGKATPTSAPTAFKPSSAARKAESLRVKTSDGEVNGRTHVDQLVQRGFTQLASTRAGDKLTHALVNAAGESEPIHARQLAYAQEKVGKAITASAGSTTEDSSAVAPDRTTAPAEKVATETPTETPPSGGVSASEVAQHIEPGEPPVPATAKEIAASAREAAPTVGMAVARKELLRQIDEAAARAPSEDEDGKIMLGPPYKENRQKVWSIGMDRTLANGLDVPSLKIVEGTKAFLVYHGRELLATEPSLASAKFEAERLLRAADWKAGGKSNGKWDFSGTKPADYVTLDVPGDGKFKVLNTRERLAAFRKEVEAKFKQPGAVKVPNDGTGESRSLRMNDATREKILSEAERVDEAAHEAATSPQNDRPEPTEGQIEAGNYKKGHVDVQGLDISIENPRGSTRSGVGENGKPWSHVMTDHYGYIRRTEGADGEQVDVYLGPHPESDRVYVVDQIDQKTGKFDEHKAMLGFDSEAAAVAAYKGNFDKGWKVGPVSAMSMDEFKAWLKEGDTTKPLQPVAETTKAAPQTAAADQGAANTKDAGEELWANRRNSTGKGLAWTDIADLNDTLKAREAVKSKVWPRPNYGELVEGGMPAPIAHVIKQMYDALATRPQTRGVPTDAQYQDYIAAVHRMRDAAFDWARQVMETTAGMDDKAAASVREVASKGGIDPAHAAAITSALRLAQARNYPVLDAVFPMPKKEDFREPSRFRTGEQGKANNALGLLLGGNKFANALQVGERSLRAAFKAVEGGWPAAKSGWEISFTIHEAKGAKPEFFVVRKGTRRVVADGLATRAEAEAAAQAAYARLRTSGGDGAKAEAPVALQDARQGPARRLANEDVSSDQLRETFGFKGINFGNWMKGGGAKNAAERQAHLNHAYDAFHDLAEIMGLPPKAMSLNGTLGLAFGAQGSGGKRAAAAHFVPGVNEINLTREQGAGSLAHEWAHALDHYFAVQAGGLAAKDHPFLTEQVTRAGDGIRPEVRTAFLNIVQAMTTRAQTAEELAARLNGYQKRGRDGVEQVLRTARQSIERNGKGDTTAALEQFDELAKRLRVGDVGEGYVKTGKGRMDSAPQVVAQVANLVKETTGRKPDWTWALASYAKMVSGAVAAKSDNTTRAARVIAARVPSDFAKEAHKLEGTRKTPYWSTKLEMFARAFQSYVLDKLAAEGNRNHYLTRQQMSGEEFARLKADPETAQLMEAGDRYPRGAEREAINKAFDTLTGELKTREGEDGRVALFSIDADGNETTGRQATTFAEARQAAEDFVGQPITNDNGLVPATVSNTTLGKMLSDSAVRKSTSLADHVRAVANLDTLYRTGMLDQTHADSRGEPTIAAIHRVVAPMVGVNGEVLAVKMTVKETTHPGTPNPLYSVETLEVDPVEGVKPARKAPQRGIERAPGQGRNAPQAGFSDDVTRMLQEFKQRLFRRDPEGATDTADAPVTPAQEAHRARIEQIATAAKSVWKGGDVPALRVVATPEQLPQSAKVAAGGLASTAYKTAAGMYDGRTIWIVASKHTADPAGLRKLLTTMAHEGVGHYGIDRIVTRELGEQAWAKIEEATERLRANPKKASPAIQKVLADVESRYSGADATTFAREFLAVSAEQGVRNSLLDRVVMALRRLVRRMGEALQNLPALRGLGDHLADLTLHERELRQLLVASDQYLRVGETQQQRVQSRAALAFNRNDQTLTPAFKNFFGDWERLATQRELDKKMRPGSYESPGALARPLGETPITGLGAFVRQPLQRVNPDTVSKVVDADGNPLPVYHGTAEEFDTFDPARSGSTTAHMTANLGTFFAESREKAQHYAENASQGVPAEERVIDAYLAIRKPYTLSLKQFMGIDSQEESAALRQKLIAEGYDGIHLPEVQQWIAFQPNQIKSASENRGTFDTSTGNIYFSRDDADPDNPAPARRPFGDASASIESMHAELPQLDRTTLQKAKDWIAGKARDFEPVALGALQLRHVLELAADDPTLKQPAKAYGELYQRMDGDRNQMTQDGAAKVDALQKWARAPGLAGWLKGKIRPEAAALFKFMHAVTQLAVDPTNAYERLLMRDAGNEYKPWTKDLIKERIRVLRKTALSRSGDDKTRIYDEIKELERLPQRERVRQERYPKLVAQWNALSPEAKHHFEVMRDHYQEQSAALEAATIKQLEGLDIPDAAKRQALLTVRDNFRAAKVDGVYFPLTRFGDYWLSLRRKDGEYVFAKYETANEMQQAEKRWLADGAEIEARGRQDNNYRAKDAPSGTFIGDLMGILKNAPDKTKDEIYQMYLKTLPALSLRKHGIHRSNVAGYTDDVPRAFASSVFHGAHQISKARYGWQLQATMEQMRERMEARRTVITGTQAAHGDALLGELNRRHDWIMNPTNNQLANHLTSIGFSYFLAASPASALVNLIQVPQIVLPVLSAQHGWGRTTRVLTATMRDAIRTGGHIDRVLTGEDLLAFKALQEQGTFQRSATHALAGISEGDQLRSSPAYAKVMNALSWMFHTSEVINREGTGMAAYRLAREKGQSFEEAVKYADEMTNGTHGDYSNANRARYMQGNTMKVLTQFKNYSLAMSWLWGRQIHQAFKGESPEVRAVARKTLTGMLGMTGLFAGVVGMPIFNLLRYGAMAAHAVGGDPDEPWDFMTEFRAWLAEHLGETAANLIADGAASELGANVASRVSMSDLWFRDADRQLEGEDAYNAMLQAIAGPLGGLVKNMYVGAQQFNEGHTERGIETMLPTFAKNAVRAVRYASQGVNTLRGDPIVADISAPQALIQAIGFQPTTVARQMRTNNSLYTYQQAILERRQALMNGFAMAVNAGDVGGQREAMQRIQKFNRTNPDVVIGVKNLRNSLRQRARFSAEADNGIRLNKKLAARLREDVGAPASP